ncbi:hypothetical protein PtA15_18A434 [Puccinia triticina]|uniref:F-box domain-containing protein n=1 Tax=Puccinia triticina TaxID=208348 RepID=A0ABY7D6T5_9BASI|nr:uncharacterized protein PtA15_18A434 [Puccinia triticina]WAQ93374.1 hypothetical protein PtA15_18A434 [Puccinia triticina]
MPATPGSASKTRPARGGLDSFAREELMASLSSPAIPSAQAGGPTPPSPSPKTIRPSLSQLPFEIKQRIVYWLNRFEEIEQPFDSDDSDIEEVDDDEFTDKPPRKSPQKIITRSQAGKTSPKHPSPPEPSPKPPSTEQNSIHALSLVDRSFYEICRPFIWQTLDLENFALSKLRDLRTEVLPRHAECVRRIWWRVDIAELETYEPESWMSGTEEERVAQRPTEWGEEGRSVELLEILKMCTKATSLDVDLKPARQSLDEHQEFIIEPGHPTAKFLQPISQMTLLTTIALTAPSDGFPFTEPFLVRLIRDMAGLQSFTCCSIEAHAPDIEHSSSITVCESPLALHLSKLDSLKELDLDQADCFDLSWSTIDWAGALENLALDDCCRVSLTALHSFCMKFSKSLASIELSDVPYDPEVFDGGLPTRTISELETGRFRFKLPELTTLSISSDLPIIFLEAFEDCKKIKLLELALNPSITATEVERLINPDSWPLLEKVIIAPADSDLSAGQIEALELFYLSKGVATFHDYQPQRV